MPARLRAIIFDIGRVLIRVDVARAMPGLVIGSPLSPAELWAAIEKDPLWPDLQVGRLSPHDWYLHLARRLADSITFQQFCEAWNRALDPVPIHKDAFFAQLGKRYKLALLSNTDPIHVKHMEATYKFFEHFPVRIYSCAVGCSKPNPLIFQHVLKAVKVHAEEALFIDDIPAYVEAAQSLGMAAIPFQSATQLIEDLKAYGVEMR
jgi:glucose-1-phosphatase